MDKLPPKWISAIERKLFKIQGNWLPILMAVFLIWCLLASINMGE